MGAYDHYTKLWQRANLPMESSVLIRLGLASEMAGLLDQAEKHYRSAIRVSQRGSTQQLASLLGTARIWEQQGHLDDAIGLLGELFLLYTADDQPATIRQSIVKQLADCLQRRLLETEVVAKALNEDPLEYHFCPIAILPILELADYKPPGAPPGNPATGLKVLQNLPGDVSLVLVEAHLDGVSVLQLLTDLEQLSERPMLLTDKAKSELVGRLTNVSTPAMPVSLLLDQVLETLRLTWIQSEDGITVMHRNELSDRDAASYELARTQRMIGQVQLLFGNGLERTAALMNDGNNARLSGGWEEAAERYRSARESKPLNELSAKLFYNEASLGLMQGENLQSLNACYMALDQTLVPALQAQIYATIADLELDFGHPGKSIVAASRAVRRTEDRHVHSRAVMTLARAYLLSGDPFSANSVLFNAGPELEGAKTKRLASVFATFARFQHVKPKVGLQDEGQRLVIALASLAPDDVTSFADSLIVANAYSAVGLRSKAIDNLNVSLETAPAGYWSERIRLQLAKMYFDASDYTQANAVIESFGAVSPDRLPEVLLLHASIQFESDQHAACESICRRLLAMEIDDETKAQTLEVMGRSLQKAGNHYAAAICFAGLLPDTGDLPEATNASEAEREVGPQASRPVDAAETMVGQE